MGTNTLRSGAVLRRAGMLRTALGPAIAEWLDDPAVIEVMLNLDGRIWIDPLTDGLADTGECVAPAGGERIIRLVAHHVGAKAHPSNRRISAELPETGERFEGLLPLIVAAPAFAIRKPAVAIFTPEDDVSSGIMLQHALGAAAAAGAAIGRRPGRENHRGDYHHHNRSDARLRRFELSPDVLFFRWRGARLMGWILLHETVAGFAAPIHRALTEPILLGGAPCAV